MSDIFSAIMKSEKQKKKLIIILHFPARAFPTLVPFGV